MSKKYPALNMSENAARPWTGAYRSRPNGGSFYVASCPFCGTRQEVSAWSVRGGGKRCERSDCRAMFCGWGHVRPAEGQEGREPGKPWPPVAET